MSVYFITCREVDLVKIGCAYNPVARFNHLRTSCPLELALEGAIPGGFKKERELHDRHAKFRVRGEWFEITPSIEAEIEASSRPEKFTWASVRLWLKKLQDQSDPAEEVGVSAPVVLRREMPWERERRLRDEALAEAMKDGLTYLGRLEAVGDIHFPFRAKARAA